MMLNSYRVTGIEKYIMYDKSAQVRENVTQLINSLESIFRSSKKVETKKLEKNTKQVSIVQASEQ